MTSLTQSYCYDNDQIKCFLNEVFSRSDALQLDDIKLYVIYGVNIALVLLFWICFVFRIRRDYADYYFLSFILPYTVSLAGVVARKIMISQSSNNYSTQIYSLIKNIEYILLYSSQIIFLLTTLLFLLFTIIVSCTRKYIHPCISFFLNELICGLVIASLALNAFIPNQTWKDVLVYVNYLPLVATVGTVILLLLTVLTCVLCCCCSSDQHDNVVVYNSRRRLFWHFIYVVVVYVVNCALSLYAENKPLNQIFPINNFEFSLNGIRPYLLVTFPTMHFFGIYVLIPAFILLPTYRSALFCLSSKRGTILPTTSK